MRWDNLFDDLESQLSAEISADEADLLLEEERMRVARLSIRDRIRALLLTDSALGDRGLRLVLLDGAQVNFVPATYGSDWLAGELFEQSGRRPHCIIPLDAVSGAGLEPAQVAASIRSQASEPASQLSTRLTLQMVLRDLCRRRAAIELRLPTTRLHGTIDRVGSDHLDLAIHEPGAPRRESLLTEYRIVRLAEIALVRL